MNPYKPTEETMAELHSRSQQKLGQLFPRRTPDEILKRIAREKMTLSCNPYIYALLIADEVFKQLRKHQFTAYLHGGWGCCYYAWLLDLAEYDPFATAKCYQRMGLRMKRLVEDKCIESPIEIVVSPAWAKPACLELLRMHADAWGFYLWESPKGEYKLINLSSHPNDMYASYAPVIRVVGTK